MLPEEKKELWVLGDEVVGMCLISRLLRELEAR
jgi:hypothetical protein